MNDSRNALSRSVLERAQGRCEYCQMSQSLQGATFHIEHVVPRAKGGESNSANLALACPSCNLTKSDRTTARDPETGAEVELFHLHPRRHRWGDHLEWDGVELIGNSEIGRALIDAFDLNSGRRQKIREAERMFELFPPS